MGIPKRLQAQSGRYSLVDGIPFHLPVYCRNSPCLMAAFSINADKARALLPGNEIYPLRLWNKGVLVITVIDYRDTVIGKYIEYPRFPSRVAKVSGACQSTRRIWIF